MKVIAVNGSPRKKGNTATLLAKALEGAKSKGAETELIHLYDLNYKGCISCYACKLKTAKTIGKCAVRDELAPILDRIADADALIMGSPLYLAMITGEMKSFLERLTYPYVSYARNYPSSLFSKKFSVGFIYNMGVTDAAMKERQYDWQIKANQTILDFIFGKTESIIVNDTYQFDDYSKYITAADVAAKEKRRREVFPIDCQKAFDMGARFATKME
jgi:multimeric flavodoxin WrbA